MENYGEAKARLFTRPDLKTAIVNVGDRFGAGLADRELTAQQIIRVAVAGDSGNDVDAELVAELLSADANGLRIRFSGAYGTTEFTSPMWGRFNVENLAIAAGILIAHGFGIDQIVAALARIEAPAGRMQVLRGGADRPTVVIDFAHTPDALEQVLRALRDHCTGSVACVFGCGGDRDRGKRSAMGAIAAANADRVVVTDDNPRHEDPDTIVEAILAGSDATDSVDVIRDRATAIAAAIEQASVGDAVLIAGKGSETHQLIGNQRNEFSDAAVARAALGGDA